MRRRTRDLIARLREHGHREQADRVERQLADGVERQLSLHGLSRGALFALREACETLLTAVEAIDPVTQTMVEELRLEVEKRLRLSDAQETP
ncbi:MAG TPA: hypothetical protein VL614_28855 [Acetobacteraceae bacterium]|nr:hypothetical protein [Acetobacteraceae bacterium]